MVKDSDWITKLFAKLPYVFGGDAYRSGLQMADNPYPAESRDAIKWASAWVGHQQAHFYRRAWKTGYIAGVLGGTNPYPVKCKHAESWQQGFKFAKERGSVATAKRMHSKLPNYLQ